MITEKKKVNLLLVFESLVLVAVLVLVVLTNISKAAERIPSSENSQSEVVGSEDTEASSETEKLPEDTEGDVQDEVTFSASVEAMLASMTNAQKVAQLFVVTPEQLTGVDKVTVFGNTSKMSLDTYPVAGMVYSSLNLVNNEQLQTLVNGAKDYYLQKNGMKMWAIAEDAQMLALNVGFDGNLTVTKFDGASESAEGCLKAFAEGADAIYMPADFKGSYQAILDAVNDGTVSIDRLNEAVGSILTAKGV